MKKIFIALTTVLLISCQQSVEEKLIADYVQTFGKSKIDANFKMKSIDKTKDITAKDSLVIIKKYFETKKEEKISYFNEGIAFSKKRLESNTKELSETNPNHEGLIKIYKGIISDAEKNIVRNQESIKLYNGDCKGSFLEPIILKISEYEKQGNEIIYSEYKAVYSINNPMLNNVKQEFEKDFYISSDKKTVIEVE